jgi:predicted nucleic acid-binding protein
MMLCVETNFLLELAYLQDEHEACEHLLDLVERGQIRFAIPAFCIVEVSWFSGKWNVCRSLLASCEGRPAKADAASCREGLSL